MSSRVARRYAKALFALAQESGTLDTVTSELIELRAALAPPEIAAVVSSPMMTVARLTELAKSVAAHLRLSELTARFLGVLASNRRFDQLAGIADHFQALHDRALGRIRVTIRTAVPLGTARQSDLTAAFEMLTGHTVLATVTVDPELLGGLVVEAEGKVYDGSLRMQLEHIAREITGARTYL